MNSPRLILTPRRPALLAGFDNTLDVLIRVQAPDMPESASRERTALNLALVIDRSGSMSGLPLQEAKRCLEFVVDRLKPADRASLIAYDDDVETLVRSTQVSDKSRFHSAIDRIDDRGCTNLHGGWLAGAEEVSEHIDPAVVSRVILLSDGQANRGLTDMRQIFSQCEALAGEGVTTSTYGLGSSFNEELMIGMARHGQGQSYYGQTAEDLMDPFQEEFSLLEALYSKQLYAGIIHSDDVSAKVLNRFPETINGSYRLSDLAYSAESWMVVRLHIPKALSGNGDGSTLNQVLKVGLAYKDLDGTGHTLESNWLELPSLHSSAWKAVTEDELVVRRAGELEAANIQDQARVAAREGDWPKVKSLLRKVREQAIGNEWLQEVVTNLEELAKQEDEVLFSKETQYQASYMRSRIAQKDEVQQYSRSDSAPKYLRRKVERGKKQ